VPWPSPSRSSAGVRLVFNEQVEGGNPLDIDHLLSNCVLDFSKFEKKFTPFLVKQGAKWRVGTPDMRAPINREERRERITKWLKTDLPSLKEQPLTEEPMAICCYGPSLLDHIDDIRAHQGKIMTVSGAHDVLLSHGITPDYHVEMDPREHKAAFVLQPSKKTTYFISSGCHDQMFENLKHSNVVLWNLLCDMDDHEFNIALRPDDLTVHVGSAVGLGGIIISRILGHVKMDVYGMDCSAREKRHAGPHNGKPQKLFRVECEGRSFMTSAQMIAAARDFFAMCRDMPAYIDVKGDGLLQHWLEAVIKRKEATNA
jgi:hypothetical protein